MLCQLSGLTDLASRFARVLETRQLDDDALLAGPGKGRLCDAQGIDATTQDAQGAIGGFGIGFDAAGILRLEDDLGAALEVEPELGWAGEGEDEGNDDNRECGERPPERGTSMPPEAATSSTSGDTSGSAGGVYRSRGSRSGATCAFDPWVARAAARTAFACVDPAVA